MPMRPALPALILLSNIALHAQTMSQSHALAAVPSPATATYDVVSIHPHDPNDRTGHVMAMYDQYDAVNTTLSVLLRSAFGVTTDDQVVGIPPALRNGGFDILAKPDAPTVALLEKLSRDEASITQQHMMLVLLEERFSLKAHVETRELPAYFMTIARAGLKLKEVDPSKVPNATIGQDGKPKGGGMLQVQFGGMTAQGITAEMLARNLQYQIHRLVHDNTNLTGRYDFTLTWNPDPLSATADTTKPDLLTALEEQLGLKLIPGKAPATVVIIDHLEPPTPN